MTDNVALRAAMNDMFGDLQKERRYSGSRAALPNPQPGLAAPDPTIAPGSRCSFAALTTIPMVTPVTAVPTGNEDPEELAAKQVSFTGLTLVTPWIDTEQGSDQLDFTSHAGGPSPDPTKRTADQGGVQPTYQNSPSIVS